MVKTLDERSNGLGFDSRNAGHMCAKHCANFESTLPLSTRHRWVPGARYKVGSTVLAVPLWLRGAGGGRESAEHACMNIRLQNLCFYLYLEAYAQTLLCEQRLCGNSIAVGHSWYNGSALDC